MDPTFFWAERLNAAQQKVQRAFSAAPPWATTLSARNAVLFVGIAVAAWVASHHPGEMTAEQTRYFQWLCFSVVAWMALAFIVRTIFDARRHRMAQFLLANPEQFRNAMQERGWIGVEIIYAPVPLMGMPRSRFVGFHNFHELGARERYRLAKEFLNYLATLDTRWWTPYNIRRSAKFMVAGMLAVVTTLPFELVHLTDNCRRRRKS